MTRKKIFVLLYIGIIIVAIGYLVVATVNYLQFYPALLSLRADPVDQQIVRNMQGSPIMVLLHLKISNPTGYSGIKLEGTVVRLYFTARSQSIFENFRLLGTNSTSGPLNPGGSVRLLVLFPLTNDQSNSFANFLATYDGSVISQYDVFLSLFTFLDALAPNLQVLREFQYSNS